MQELQTLLSNGKGLWFSVCKHCPTQTPPLVRKDALRILAGAKAAGWKCVRRPAGDHYLICPRCLRYYDRIAGERPGGKVAGR